MKLKRKDIGTVIARRELELGDKTVEVVIGKPRAFPDGRGDYYCPYRITGLGKEKIRYGGGVDPFQALILAIKLIGIDLYNSPAAKAGKLTWLG